MPMIPMRPILEAAAKGGYAHGAFNVNTAAQAEAAVEAHEMLRSAAIVQGAELALAFMGSKGDFMKGTLADKRLGAQRLAKMVYAAAERSSIPVALHLDHGKDLDVVKAAIDAGFTSVMIDGSSLSYGDNVEITREAVKYAHPLGVSVEGELGVLAGVEDHVFSESSTYTDPVLALDFIKKTGADCLAISYGTQHGAVKGEHVKLRREIAIATAENLRHAGIPALLVSHGSSSVPRYIVDKINALGGRITGANGIPTSEIQEVIACGICKINIDTDIRLAVTRNLLEFFAANLEKKNSPSVGAVWQIMSDNPDKFDPRGYLTPIIDEMVTGLEQSDADIKTIAELNRRAVLEIAATQIVQFGSAGHSCDVDVTR